MRQGIAHHVVNVLGTAGHPAEKGEAADENHTGGNQNPLERSGHKSRLIMRVAKLFAQGFITCQRFFNDVHGGVGWSNVFYLNLLAFELLVVLEETFHYGQAMLRKIASL